MVYSTTKRKIRHSRVILAVILITAIIASISMAINYLFSQVKKIPQIQINDTREAGVYPDSPSDIVIVLDPGHGWTDIGAERNGVEERMLNASLSQKVAEKLQFHGYQVVFSHDISYATHVQSDIKTLLPKMEKKYDIENELAPAINEKNPHIMISIHHNAMPEEEHQLRGFEAFYRNNNDGQVSESKQLATNITNAMTSLDFLSPKEEAVVDAQYLINLVEMPSILLEVGYMSNAAELSLLVVEENQDKIAEQIVSGIIDFFGRD